MISYRKKFIRFVECWNGEVAETKGADVTRFFQQLQPRDQMLCREFYTVLINLIQEDDEILSGIKRGTRYEIRRAQADDNLSHHRWDGIQTEIFEQFCNDGKAFLAQKGQPQIDQSWLKLLAEAKSLALTYIADATAQPLVWHAYHRSKERVTLLYSISFFRNHSDPAERAMIGRANRLLHWLDMMHFKKADIRTYDFGGWYEGSTDTERLSINKFKEQFGGEVVKNYICEQALTIKGALFLRLRSKLLGNAI